MAGWNVITAFVLDQIYGYQTANKVRENLITLASRRAGRYLGGSRILPVFPCFDEEEAEFESLPPGLGPHDVGDAVDIEIDGTNQGGMTFQARVEVRTRWPGCSITPKIRNMTTSADSVVGAACTEGRPDFTGTNQKQTLVMALVAGANKYRLQYTLSKLGYGMEVWIIGEIEAFANA